MGEAKKRGTYEERLKAAQHICEDAHRRQHEHNAAVRQNRTSLKASLSPYFALLAGLAAGAGTLMPTKDAPRATPASSRFQEARNKK